MDLTVAICMYNAERYIEETLDCLLKQTRQDFKLLIVNDCSTDNGGSLVEQFFIKHPRQYELVNLPENKGIAYARNYAINHADTKYFIFVDADDCPLPSMLEREYATITSDPDLIAVSCYSDFMDANGNRLPGGLFVGDNSKEAFMERASRRKRIFLTVQTMFVREYAIRAGGYTLTGFPEGKPRYRDFCEDMDLWTRMSDFYAEGKAMITLNEVLYRYRKTNGLSSNHFNMIVKMDYVKRNLILRREGKKELTFIEYMNQIPADKMRKLKRSAKAADNLKNGVFYLKHKRPFHAIACICKCIWYEPDYIIKKLKNNTGH